MAWTSAHTAVTLALTGLALAGCSTIVPDEGHSFEAREQISRVDEHGAFPAIRRNSFEQVNLVELIDPHGMAERIYKDQWDRYNDERKWGVRYDLVLAWFREQPVSDETKMQHRNAVQDRILAVSTSRCNVFKTYLRRRQTDMNFALGSATTVAGVLGAVLGGVNSSRNLSATAGIFSGLQAEFNQTYYSNLAASVIIQGVELVQGRLKRQLIEARSKQGIATYSMEAAINDAIYIDGTCSTITGLQEASESIKQVSNPGLTHATEIITRAKALREIEQGDFPELLKSGQLDVLVKRAAPSEAPMLATVLSKSDTATSVNSFVSVSVDATARLNRLISALSTDIGKAFVDAQKQLPKSERKLKEDADIEVRAKSVSQLFRDEAAKAVKQLPIQTCIDAMTTPAKAAAEAQVQLAMAGSDEIKRLAASQAFAVARANAAAASARVDLLVTSATQGLEPVARQWIAAARSDNPEDKVFTALFASDPLGAARLKDLCK